MTAVRLLETLRTADELGSAGSFFDAFDTLHADWDTAAFADDGAPTLASGSAGTANGDEDAEVGLVLNAQPINPIKPVRVEVAINLAQWSHGEDGAAHTYFLYIGLVDETAIATNTVIGSLVISGPSPKTAELDLDSSGGAHVGTQIYAPTFAQKTKFGLEYDNGVARLYLGDTLVLSLEVPAPPGTRIGFVLRNGELLNPDHPTKIESLHYTYTPTTIDLPREAIIASAEGVFRREISDGTMEILTTNTTLTEDDNIMGVNRLGNLYIADFGPNLVKKTDGTVVGTVLDSATVANWSALQISADDHFVDIQSVTSGSTVTGTYKIVSIDANNGLTLNSAPGNGTGITFRVLRAPKVYNSTSDTLTIWTPTSGFLPAGCQIITRFRDRLSMAGDFENPTIWYMSGLSAPNVWLFDSEDANSAVAATDAIEAGQLGFPITAMMPIGDDYLLVAAASEFAVLKGDPLFGGQFLPASDKIGIIGRFACTSTAEGIAVFLAKTGIYTYVPNSLPQLLSRDIPKGLLDIDTSLIEPVLQYDPHDNGIWVFLTPKSGGPGKHYWIDWPQRSISAAVELHPDHEPQVTTYLAKRDRVIFGCRDGYLREPADEMDNDDGEPINSHVNYGPIPIGNGMYDGIVDEFGFTFDDISDDVTWELFVGDTAQQCENSSPKMSGVFHAGRNPTIWSRLRGRFFMVRLSGTGRWAPESGTARRHLAGRYRG